MALTLNYPLAADTDSEKLAFCHRVQEYTRFLHNFFGKWYTSGLTLDQYNNGIPLSELSGKGLTKFVLPPDMKAKYAYKASVTKEELTTMKQDEWDRLWRLAQVDLDQLVRTLKDSTTYDGDIDLDNL